jgi:hypothetical protein
LESETKLEREAATKVPATPIDTARPDAHPLTV